MCTILTTDKITDNILNRIAEDHQYNPHGLSVVTYDGVNYEILKTLDLNTVLTILRSREYKRIFVHTRNATTWSRGVNATHGFIQGDYVYFHNGIFRSRGALQYPVDSMMLGDVLRMTAPDNIQKTLSALGETFANIMIVDTKLDKYHVIRQSTGSLFTDNQGNYSTNPVDDINIPVPENTAEAFPLRIVPVHTFRFNTDTPAPAPDLSEIYDRHYDRGYLSSSFRDESLSETEKIQLKNDLRMINPDTFLDLVYDYGFEKRSIRSQEFHDLCNSKQRKHLRQIQRENDRMNKNRKLWGAL